MNSHRLNHIGLMAAACAALLALGFAPASAQTFKATLVGQVTDANGAVVPGATVTVIDQGTGRAQTVTTNDEGVYTIPQLQPGRYDLKIEAASFRPVVQKDLVLETDKTQRVNVQLEAGSVDETITVVADAPVVNTDTSDKGEVITNRQVQELPLNGRDATDLAQLVPGVYQRPAEDDQGQGLAVAGTRTDSTNFILDGANNRSDRNGSIGVNTSVDSIREFKVSTSTYSAEFGRTAGGQINVVSKSGTNDFHGAVFDYLRNDAFDAANFFSGKKDLRRNQFGGTLGGPVPFFNFGEGGPAFRPGRDRTFFFVSYEGTREDRSSAFIRQRPERGVAARRLPQRARRRAGRRLRQRRRHQPRPAPRRHRQPQRLGHRHARRVPHAERHPGFAVSSPSPPPCCLSSRRRTCPRPPQARPRRPTSRPA